MKAEIIASGTELLLGEITDINTPFIAGHLAAQGIDLYYASIVGDNHERFRETLKQALSRSDLVIITGGLGPTKGDITREVIAETLGEELEINPELRLNITNYFARSGNGMPENNLKQASLIPSASAIMNPLGTAPGWWVEKQGKIIISLPGPPNEMQPMWEKEILPKLEKMGKSVIVSRVLKTWGISEAKLDQLVGHYMSDSNPTLALYAKPDCIQIRITAKAANKSAAQEMILEREAAIREILKENVWGVDNESLETVTGKLILNKGLTVAAVESFTGGFLTYTLTNLPESQQFFMGGIVALDAASRHKLGFPPDESGKIDGQTAAKMAVLAREHFGADIGIGIDGYIESKEGINTGKSFVAISLKSGEIEKWINVGYPGRPYQLVRRSVTHALFSLRRLILSG